MKPFALIFCVSASVAVGVVSLTISGCTPASTGTTAGNAAPTAATPGAGTRKPTRMTDPDSALMPNPPGTKPNTSGGQK